MQYIFLLVSFFSSVAGTICGIGGGIIIKPVLDAFKIMSVSSINFLSGCTVLSMSIVSVIKAFSGKTEKIQTNTASTLAAGAVLGGILGKILFEFLKEILIHEHIVSLIQSAAITIITIATIFFTIKKDSIKTFHFKSIALNIFIGLILGLLSSFLGIGGGPVNIVALILFFSMGQKEAAINSLYIIMFSQLAGLGQTILTGSIPKIDPVFLVFMILGGITGSLAGSRINKAISDKTVAKLFLILMIVIVFINLYNVFNFSAESPFHGPQINYDGESQLPAYTPASVRD